MKAKEIKEYLLYHQKNHDEDEVVIQLSKPSLGSISSCAIKNCSIGFDWDCGKIILTPYLPIVPKSQQEALFDEAFDLLYKLSGETKNSNGKNQLTFLAKKVRNLFTRNGIKPMDVNLE